MQGCDVIVVGGGPAGSTCAGRLHRAGVDVVVLDRAHFPRDKPCAGWVTPAVFELLELEPAAYSRHGVIEEIRGFRVSILGGRAVEIGYQNAVSHAVRRCEFDAFLLARSGARVRSGTAVETIERNNGAWRVNDEWEAPVLVGAGGHFCPVARYLGAAPAGEAAIVAQESEFELSGQDASVCAARRGVAELAFCKDLAGYGWCVRKGNWLNIGLGTLRQGRLKVQLKRWVEKLRAGGILPAGIEPEFRGHAYLMRAASKRVAARAGVLMTGDAAGLAYSSSGEGILPAVRSGALAAEVILQAGLNPERLDHGGYAASLETALGKQGEGRRGASIAERLAARAMFYFPARVKRDIIEQRFLRLSPGA